MSSSDTISAPQRLEAVLADARDAMAAYRQPDGHWIFELEADVTISAEYILLQHFLGEIDEDEVRRSPPTSAPSSRPTAAGRSSPEATATSRRR